MHSERVASNEISLRPQCGWKKRKLSATTPHLAVSGVCAGPAVEAPPEQRKACGQREALRQHSHCGCLNVARSAK
jgi:hypothetical protein